MLGGLIIAVAFQGLQKLFAALFSNCNIMSPTFKIRRSWAGDYFLEVLNIFATKSFKLVSLFFEVKQRSNFILLGLSKSKDIFFMQDNVKEVLHCTVSEFF